MESNTSGSRCSPADCWWLRVIGPAPHVIVDDLIAVPVPNLDAESPRFLAILGGRRKYRFSPHSLVGITENLKGANSRLAGGR